MTMARLLASLQSPEGQEAARRMGRSIAAAMAGLAGLAASLVRDGRPVHFLTLEAEPDELERRIEAFAALRNPDGTRR